MFERRIPCVQRIGPRSWDRLVGLGRGRRLALRMIAGESVIASMQQPHRFPAPATGWIIRSNRNLSGRSASMSFHRLHPCRMAMSSWGRPCPSGSLLCSACSRARSSPFPTVPGRRRPLAAGPSACPEPGAPVDRPGRTVGILVDSAGASHLRWREQAAPALRPLACCRFRQGGQACWRK